MEGMYGICGDMGGIWWDMGGIWRDMLDMGPRAVAGGRGMEVVICGGVGAPPPGLYGSHLPHIQTYPPIAPIYHPIAPISPIPPISLRMCPHRYLYPPLI